MEGSDVVATGLAYALIASVVVLAAIVVVLSASLVRTRRRADTTERRADGLRDGTVLRARQGIITDLSDRAHAIPGAEPGAKIADVLAPLMASDDADGLGALTRLIERGEEMHLLLSDGTDMPREVIGYPSGGETVVVLRDARFIVNEMKRAANALSARERSLSAQWYQRETVAALTESGAAIAWQRAPDGAIAWCAGTVSCDDGSIDAEQVTAVLAARLPAGEKISQSATESTRVEILPAGSIEPVPLKVVECTMADGRRIGIAVDGSEAASAERTLSRFVQTMTETFAHLTVGLAIFDRNQTLALFNPALAQMLQLDPSWLANRPSLRDVVDTLRSSRRIPETTDFHAWRKTLLGLFDDTEAVDYDEVWHLADGSSLNVLARPHPHGSLAFVLDDVSERMRLEHSYRQSVDLRHATLNRLDEGLAVFGADGLLQFVNDAFHEIFDTDSESVVPGMHAQDVLSLCQGLTVETEVWRRVAGFITSDEMRRAWSARLTLGSSRTLSTRLAPLPGGATMIVFADITDSERIALALRERNEALEAAEEMRTAVLDQISHRLRTPLNTIFGYGQLMSDTRFGELTPDQREYAEGILVASGQLLDTIDDVTELASLQIDPLSDPGSDPPLAETMELTRQLLEKRASEAGISLAVSHPSNELAMRCDAVKLRQIVFNMVAGAIQRSPSGTRLLLSATEAGDRVELSVAEMSDAQMDLIDRDGTGEALTFSVLRRMVANEGGRFERRRGPGPTDVENVCSFEAAGATVIGEEREPPDEKPVTENRGALPLIH